MLLIYDYSHDEAALPIDVKPSPLKDTEVSDTKPTRDAREHFHQGRAKLASQRGPRLTSVGVVAVVADHFDVVDSSLQCGSIGAESIDPCFVIDVDVQRVVEA